MVPEPPFGEILFSRQLSANAAIALAKLILNQLASKG
jgi:hypothetical protein